MEERGGKHKGKGGPAPMDIGAWWEEQPVGQEDWSYWPTLMNMEEDWWNQQEWGSEPKPLFMMLCRDGKGKQHEHLNDSDSKMEKIRTKQDNKSSLETEDGWTRVNTGIQLGDYFGNACSKTT